MWSLRTESRECLILLWLVFSTLRQTRALAVSDMKQRA